MRLKVMIDAACGQVVIQMRKICNHWSESVTLKCTNTIQSARTRTRYLRSVQMTIWTRLTARCYWCVINKWMLRQALPPNGLTSAGTLSVMLIITTNHTSSSQGFRLAAPLLYLCCLCPQYPKTKSLKKTKATNSSRGEPTCPKDAWHKNWGTKYHHRR